MIPRAAAMAASGLLAACVTTPEVSAPRIEGYLPAASVQALARTLPAPPARDSADDHADRAASAALRRFEHTDRWLMATAHAELSPPLALQHFDCALGVRTADADDIPALKRLSQRLMHDAVDLAQAASVRFDRPRPVALDAERAACVRLDAEGRNRTAWPSRPALYAVAYAEALAAAAPDRAEAVRAIGRALGDSAAICALNRPADVEAGRALGRQLAQAQAQDAAWRADVAAAGEEVLRLRATGRTHPACAAERRALDTAGL